MIRTRPTRDQLGYVHPCFEYDTVFGNGLQKFKQEPLYEVIICTALYFFPFFLTKITTLSDINNTIHLYNIYINNHTNTVATNAAQRTTQNNNLSLNKTIK